MSKPLCSPRFVTLVLTAMLVLAALAAPLQAAPLVAPDRWPTRVTANGVVLQVNNPLPVYRFTTPSINPISSTLQLSQQFSGIYNRQSVGEDSYLGKPRFSVANTATLSVLQQYSATGGYFAFQVGQIATDTVRGVISTTVAQRLGCQFLLNNGFVSGAGELLLPDGKTPQNVATPNNQFCDFDPQATPLYRTTLINATTQGAQGGAQGLTQDVGVVVQVPLTLNTGRFSQVPTVPLGGPGGHLSLLFRTTDEGDQGPSLDGGGNGVPGLTSVAMPFFARTFDQVRNVPTLDPVQVQQGVQQQVRAAFGATAAITVPLPSLEYFVSDAGVEQTALEPKFTFDGVTVVTDGNTIVLKQIVLPALEGGPGGFGPTVAITSPASGSGFLPGATVAVTGAISGGATPYSYTWELEDGTVVLSGTLATTGTVAVQTNQLTSEKKEGTAGQPTLRLRVIDSEGAERSAQLLLSPAAELYLPIIANDPVAAAIAAARPQGVEPQQATNYSFGIEEASDYPPYGPGGSDLGGVPPDVNGFRSRMQNYGWSRTFHWRNASAWEKDWRDCGLGGVDCSVGVDRTDFVYFSGHGGPGGISMPSNVTSGWASAENARFQRARWVSFSSCQTLRAVPNTSAAPIRRWFNAFQGAHMLLGFNSNMADIAFGERLVNNMRPLTIFGIELPWTQRTIADAWVQTAFDMNAGKPSVIRAIGTNGVDPISNKLPKPNDPLLPRPFPVASYAWYWWNE